MKNYFRTLLKRLADPDVWAVLGLFALSQILLYVICLYCAGIVFEFFFYLWLAVFELVPLSFTYFLFRDYIKKKSHVTE